MKFSVLALDYDGTIARDGCADPAVLEAITEARARQIVVLLVTGRILSDLRRVFADQGLFDVIVAENGAVLAFPNGRTRVLGCPPSREFLNELLPVGSGIRKRRMRGPSRCIRSGEDSGGGAESRAAANARIQSRPRDDPAAGD
jgi:hypothetical protein